MLCFFPRFKQRSLYNLEIQVLSVSLYKIDRVAPVYVTFSYALNYIIRFFLLVLHIKQLYIYIFSKQN
jgi:hypothetical protein